MTKTFSECMKLSSGYQARLEQDKWEVLEQLYEANVGQLLQGCSEGIPRKLHQIWIGSEVPDQIQAMCGLVEEYNSEFEYKLWTDRDLDSLDFPVHESFNRSQNHGQRSDILRYAIMHHHGGIYADTDFIPVKPFDPFTRLDFFAGVAYDRTPTMFNGLFGCAPNTEFTKKLNELDVVSWGSGDAIHETTGPWYFARRVFESLHTFVAPVVFPVSYFYPLPNFDKDKVLGREVDKYVSSETICAHLWNSSWM